MIVAQLGARMHYAVPRIFHEAGRLHHFYTDICAAKGWPRLLSLVPSSVLPAGARRLAARRPGGVPSLRITSFTCFGQEYARRRSRARTPTEITSAHLWAGKGLCDRVLKSGLAAGTGAYCFNSAGLELLSAVRRAGGYAVIEQSIAPKRIERQLLKAEAMQFPDWEPETFDSLADEFIAREEAEWQQSHVIVCGSSFVRDSIASSGGPADRCVVVPYGVDFPLFQGRTPDEGAMNRKLRVLTVGAVGLRKGSPYVLAAARELQSIAEFRMVGSIGVSPETAALLGQHVQLTGPVPRSEIHAHFAWADVFLLPSICEGSATVTYEALGVGLPVICTPNTGSVVDHGIQGYIVEARDVAGIVYHLRDLASDRSLLVQLSRAAECHARQYTVNAYAQRLLSALDRPCS